MILQREPQRGVQMPPPRTAAGHAAAKLKVPPLLAALALPFCTTSQRGEHVLDKPGLGAGVRWAAV